MTNSSQKTIFEEVKEALHSVKDGVNKQVHTYSSHEAWRDIKKTAVITSTAMLTILSCFVTSAE